MLLFNLMLKFQMYCMQNLQKKSANLLKKNVRSFFAAKASHILLGKSISTIGFDRSVRRKEYLTNDFVKLKML